MWQALIPVGMGLLKSRADNKRYQDQMRVEAIKERYSPWTGRGGRSMAAPDSTGTMMQAGLAGLNMYQGMEAKADAAAGASTPQTMNIGPTMANAEAMTAQQYGMNP